MPTISDNVGSMDLLPHHAALLAASAISGDVARSRGYRSVTTRAELRRLGFPDSQCRVPALLLPVWDVAQEIALYQLRPDDPRIVKGKARKYETLLGSRMALDVPPLAREHLGNPTIPLFVTEGLRKADAAVSHGLCCIALLGVWNFRGRNADGGLTVLADWESIHLKGRVVYIVFDSDVMTKDAVHAALSRLGAFLISRGAIVRYVYLPSADGGVKAGMDDYLADGHSVDDLIALASPELHRPETHQDDTDDVPYAATERGLVWHRPTIDGTVPVPLTNFVARIVADIVEDDGVSTQRIFALEATLRGSTVRFDLAASQFTSMNWAVERLGAGAIVEPGQGTKDRARVAIQVLSGDMPRQVVYTHTGWRCVDGQWCYLHAAGAIGADGAIAGVTVRLEGTLSRLRLPEPIGGADLIAAVHANLTLFDLLPVAVAAPLLGATFLAVLRELLGDSAPDFVVWLHGPSGAFKSELSALGMGHFGDFTRLTLPAKFRDTANFIEGLCFIAKDALLPVDDFHPATDPREARAMEQVASRLLRGVGNGAGRGRMRADASLRPDLPPRCVPLASGEKLPDGHSNGARLFAVAIPPGAVDPAKLEVAQSQRGQYPVAMAGYLHWVAGRFESVRTTLPGRFRDLRKQAQRASGHRREPGQLAHLALGLEMWLGFAVDIGALTATRRDDLFARSWAALLAHAAEHGAELGDETPVRRFLALLTDGFAGKRAYLEGPQGGPPPDAESWGWETISRPDRDGIDVDEERHLPMGMLLGVLETDWLLLLPEATMQFVAEAARRQGQVFSVGVITLLRRLDEEQLIATEPGSGRRTPNVWIGNGTRRVIKLRRDAMTQSVAPTSESTQHRTANDTAQDATDQDMPPIPEIPPIPPTDHHEEAASTPDGEEVVEWTRLL